MVQDNSIAFVGLLQLDHWLVKDMVFLLVLHTQYIILLLLVCLCQVNPCQLRLSLPLRRKGEDGSTPPKPSLGTITVSVVFRPVASVAEASPTCLVMGVAKESQQEAGLGEGVALRRKSPNLSGRRKKKKAQQIRGRQRVAIVKEESEEDGKEEEGGRVKC